MRCLSAHPQTAKLLFKAPNSSPKTINTLDCTQALAGRVMTLAELPSGATPKPEVEVEGSRRFRQGSKAFLPHSTMQELCLTAFPRWPKTLPQRSLQTAPKEVAERCKSSSELTALQKADVEALIKDGEATEKPRAPDVLNGGTQALENQVARYPKRDCLANWLAFSQILGEPVVIRPISVHRK